MLESKLTDEQFREYVAALMAKGFTEEEARGYISKEAEKIETLAKLHDLCGGSECMVINESDPSAVRDALIVTFVQLMRFGDMYPNLGVRELMYRADRNEQRRGAARRFGRRAGLQELGGSAWPRH